MTHRLNGGNITKDWKLLIPYKLSPGQVGYIKLHKTMESDQDILNKQSQMQAAKSPKMSLEYLNSSSTPLQFKFKRDYTDKEGKV